MGLHVSNQSQSFYFIAKKVIRVLGNEDFYAHSSPVLKSLKILKFQDIYLLNLGKFLFSYTHNLLLEGFNNFFSPIDQIHCYNLRSASLIYLPFCRIKTRQFTVYYQGPKIFNSLSYDIR